MLDAVPQWFLVAATLVLAELVGSCARTAEDAETVSLPALSFLPSLPGRGERPDASVERVVSRSVWAVSPGGSRAVLGSAVAVSGSTLLAACDVAGSGRGIDVVRRSSRRPVELTARDDAGRLCELRPGSIWLRTIPGYRPFNSVAIGEPVLAVASRTSRSFDIVKGSVTGKGTGDDPFLETSLTLPAGTRSAALFDRAGNLMGFGSAGPVGDAVLVAVPIMPQAVPWLAQVRPQPWPAASDSGEGQGS